VSVASLILFSIGAFASTNIDDLLLLVGFFSDRSFPRGLIFAGQIVGMAALIGASLAAALAARALSPAHVGLLGLAPVAIGLVKLIQLGRSETPSPTTGGGILQVAAVTIADGGDNIGVYTPLFASQRPMELAATITLFAALTVVWCFAALWLVTHETLGKPIRRFGRTILPFVLIGLGSLVLYRSGALSVAMGLG
jgi:cadmium resistance protein CadD (predicted permease)